MNSVRVSERAPLSTNISHTSNSPYHMTFQMLVIFLLPKTFNLKGHNTQGSGHMSQNIPN